VSAPRHSDEKGRNSARRVLAELSVPSEPGNERLAMERIAELVEELDLSKQRAWRGSRPVQTQGTEQKPA
jgi:hypothetical protein